MPEFITTDAINRLDGAAVGATKVEAAVCYWTMPPEEFGPNLLAALRSEGSFLVADISMPTNIDSLAKFKDLGVDVHLYIFQAVGKTEPIGSKGIPDRLMHAKIFIFEYSNDEVGIWVGSHNATRRALFGLNFESAFFVKCAHGSKIHSDSLRFVNAVRRLSAEFRIQDIDFYKAIQGAGDSAAFIEIEDPHENQLSPGMVFSLFGSAEEDYAQLQKVGKSIYLSVTDPTTNFETLYKTKIKQSGYLEKRKKASTTFDKRRYAIKGNSGLPILEAEADIPAVVYKSNKYFVTLRVEQKVEDTLELLEPPRDNFWANIDLNSYVQVTAQDDQRASTRDQLNRLGKLKIQGVNLGQADALFSSPIVETTQRLLRPLPPYFRRDLRGLPLIRKRIILGAGAFDDEARASRDQDARSQTARE